MRDDQEYSVIGDHPYFFRMSTEVGIDIETTGLSFMDDIIGISLAWFEGEEIKACYLHKAKYGQMSLETHDSKSVDAHVLIQYLFREKTLFFHNIPFDYRMLWKEVRVNPPKWFYDTMHLARLLEAQDSVSLMNLYNKYIGMAPSWYKDIKASRSKLLKMPVSSRSDYAIEDAKFTLRLGMELLERIDNTANNAFLIEDMDFMKLTNRMIGRGVDVDYEWLHQRRVDFQQAMMDIAKTLFSKGLKNVGSTQAESKFLFDHLGLSSYGINKGKKGYYSVAAGVLEQWAGKVEEVDLIIAYRQYQKALGSWINPSIVEASWDGAIHSILSPFGTVTTRMSSSEFNMQAVPLKDRGYIYESMKGMFKAREKGHSYYQADIKQAEVRLVAITTKDPVLLQTIASGTDPYTEMAITIWNDPKRRQDAKHATLAAIYEVGPKKFMDEYGAETFEDASKIINAFRHTYRRTSAVSKNINHIANIHRSAKLWDGRAIYLAPDDQSYKAFNWTIQGGVATLLRKSMLETERRFPGTVVLQIHDSIILDLPDENAMDVLNEVEKIVQESFGEIDLPVPIEFKLDKEKW